MKRVLFGLFCLLLIALLVLALAVFQGNPPPVPASESDSEPVVSTPEPTPEPTPESTPEPTPESTPESTPEPTPEPTPNPTPEPEAAQVRISVVAKEQDLSQLFDGNFRTFCQFSPGEILSVSAEVPISFLYVEWNEIPQSWELTVGEEAITAGADGFLHEFVTLPRAADSFSIRLPQTGSPQISQLIAFTAGRVPDWVQIWAPPCQQADLLVVPTHADDEYVFFGGILPDYAGERGLEVQVVYMISHYASERYRSHELLNGLWLAGVRHYPVINDAPDRILSTRDSAAAFYGPDSFKDFQVEQIRRFKPLVIVDHDEWGEYGNTCHQFNTYSMEQAVVLAADPDYQPESAARYGTWDTPKTYLHLYGPREARTVLDFETPLENFGGKTALEAAWAAFAQHTSQYWAGEIIYGFGTSYDCHSFGLFRSLVGPDEEKNDLMEHLVPEEWRNEKGGLKG